MLAYMAVIRKRGNAWQAIIRKKGYPQKSKSFRTKKMAEDWARTTEDKMVVGEYIDTTSARISVSDLLDRYELEITPRKKSAQKEKSRIRILKAQLGDYYLSNLQSKHIVEYVDKRLETVKSDTVRRELSTLANAIHIGNVLWKYHIRTNPVTEAKELLSSTWTLEEGEERNRRLTENEEEQLLKAAEKQGSNIENIIKIAIRTAMRRGEIARICAAHINKDKHTLYIPDVKSVRKKRSRTIPLPDDIYNLLIRLSDNTEIGHDQPLFGIHPDTITHRFAKVASLAELKNVRFHDLRHEATSRLFEMGWSIEEVRLVTGHADLKSLMRYTHLQPDRLVSKFQ